MPPHVVLPPRGCFFTETPALSSKETMFHFSKSPQGTITPLTAEFRPQRRSLLQALAALAAGAAMPRLAQAIDLFKTFQTPEAFVAEAFGNTPPPAQLLSLDDAAQSQISQVFGRRFPQARLRYWRANGRTAWIFDDLGKEGYQPTTSGFVVRAGAVESARVLIYRESRGEQVAEPTFLRQLIGGRAAGSKLDRRVDNISGATLSVLMMQRMARTALALDGLVK